MRIEHWEDGALVRAEDVPESKGQAAARISLSLAELDARSIRALRAKQAGKGKPADDATLANLDAQADALRAELAGLV